MCKNFCNAKAADSRADKKPTASRLAALQGHRNARSANSMRHVQLLREYPTLTFRNLTKFSQF